VFLSLEIPPRQCALDKQNGNTKWQDAEGIEMGQHLEYNTWIDKGIGGTAPDGYKKI
jgi:hypothetical protein